MNDVAGHTLAPLVRKLSSLGQVSEAEALAIQALPFTVRDVRAGQDLVRQGDYPSQACVMLEGLSCRFKIVGDGSRQIVSYHIPGDIPDLQSLHLGRMDHNLATVIRSRIAFVPHRALNNLILNQSRLGALLWRDALIDGSIFREWICNIGRRPAISRIAHLICEIFLRYQRLGMADGMTISFPLTQINIGDSQGLSVVHVNRVMRDLKRTKLVSIAGRKLTVLQWDALRDLADFDPDYLHLTDKA